MSDRKNLPPGCEKVDVRINEKGDVRVFDGGQEIGSEWVPAVLTVEGWKARGERDASQDHS